MADGYYLSESDRQILNELIRDYRSRSSTTSTRAVQRPEYYANADIYLARTPDTGIPALTEATGASNYDTPGSATCYIYKVSTDGTTGESSIKPVDQTRRKVFNVSHEDIGGNRWIVVVKDKFGSWFATIAGEPIDANNTGTGTGLTPSDCPQIPGVSVDDLAETTVEDYTLGYLNGCLVKIPSTNATGTGTNAGGGATGTGGTTCSPITFQQERIECVDGSIVVYVNTITLNVVDGCLTKDETGWQVDRFEGCCDCTDMGTNTGTGTGTFEYVTSICAPSIGWPRQFYAQVYDVEFGTADQLVYTLLMEWQGGLIWSGTIEACSTTLTIVLECQEVGLTGNVVASATLSDGCATLTVTVLTVTETPFYIECSGVVSNPTTCTLCEYNLFSTASDGFKIIFLETVP